MFNKEEIVKLLDEVVEIHNQEFIEIERPVVVDDIDKWVIYDSYLKTRKRREKLLNELMYDLVWSGFPVGVWFKHGDIGIIIQNPTNSLVLCIQPFDKVKTYEQEIEKAIDKAKQEIENKC